jgi:hypothetical protein
MAICLLKSTLDPLTVREGLSGVKGVLVVSLSLLERRRSMSRLASPHFKVSAPRTSA